MWPESSPVNAVNLVKKSATIPEIIEFFLGDYFFCCALDMPTVHQRHGQTEGQTDGRSTYDSNTALELRASRGNSIDIAIFGQYCIDIVLKFEIPILTHPYRIQSVSNSICAKFRIERVAGFYQ